MDYHDWHLSGYSVADFGQTIILHLIWQYPDSENRESDIEFTDVAAYHFIHTDGTIITDIEEFPVAPFIDEHEEFFKSTAKRQGLRHWGKSMDAYKRYIVEQKFKS